MVTPSSFSVTDVNQVFPRVAPPCVLGLTALVGPHVQLLRQLRYDQERPPALTLLGLEDVSKDVVPDVHDVLPLGPQQVTHNI